MTTGLPDQGAAGRAGTAVLRYGPRGLLLAAGTDRPAALAETIGHSGLDGVLDTVPAAETVTLIFADPASCDEAYARLTDPGGSPLLGQHRANAALGSRDRPGAAHSVTIPCRFDGPDLHTVAHACGMSASDVVELLTGAHLEVAFCGFSPGFAYLVGVPEPLHLPRLDTSRTRVPAGSVAIAAGYAAVYPAPSPGGWHLLGTTTADVWVPERVPPALLVPGTTVRFVRVGED